MKKLTRAAGATASVMLLHAGAFGSSQQSLRPYIMKAIDVPNRDRKLGGNDPRRRFTQDLSDGPSCRSKAALPNHVRSCGVEIMIELWIVTGKLRAI